MLRLFSRRRKADPPPNTDGAAEAETKAAKAAATTQAYPPTASPATPRTQAKARKEHDAAAEAVAVAAAAEAEAVEMEAEAEAAVAGGAAVGAPRSLSSSVHPDGGAALYRQLQEEVRLSERCLTWRGGQWMEIGKGNKSMETSWKKKREEKDNVRGQ